MCSITRYLRCSDDIEGARYEKGDGYFTIELHHGGRVTSDSIKNYVGGKVSFFDYCNVDLMSLLEIEDMVQSLGYSGKLEYHYIGDNGSMCKLKNDVALLNMLTLRLSYNVVSIYVDHLSVTNVIESQVELYDGRTFVEPANDEPVEVQCENDNDEPVEVEVQCENDNDKPVEVEVQCENDNDELVEILNDNASDSDNSTDLEYFSESDYDVEEDDALFEANTDCDAEWGGLRENIVPKTGRPARGDVDTNCNDVENHDSDDLRNVTYSSSDDDEGEGGRKKKKKKVEWPEFNDGVDMEDPQFKLGMLFSSSKTLADAIRNHAIKHGKQIKLKKCEKTRVRAICREGCKWTLYASVMQNESTLQVKTFCNEHTCPRSFVNNNVSSKWLGRRYVATIRSNPKLPLGSFQEQVMANLKVQVSRCKVSRAKQYALQLIYGTLKEQYSMVYDYGAELMRCNPGSTVKIQMDGDQFKRMYTCLGALKNGFLKYCRPLIGMDGCHLKGPTEGQLFTAIGVDANNSLYPLAYAVVEGENKDSWMWFIELIKEDIGFKNSYHWCFITDKQKGLMLALEDLCLNSEHRCCVRHLYNNFKLKHKGLTLKDALYACARATTVAEFEEQMGEVKKLDGDAFTWLAGKPPTQWSKSHFSTFVKSDMLLNNLCESFNAMILDARDKPILTMLERIRCKLMKKIHVNKAKMVKQEGLLCPKVQNILERIKDDASHCVPDYGGSPKFQVNGPDGQFVADLETLTCTCRKWELTGIPCMHDVSAMFYCGFEPEEFVHHWYHRDIYIACYENCIQPLNGSQMWPKTGLVHVQPPIYSRLPGRPNAGARRPEVDEKKNQKKGANPYKLGKEHQNSLKCGKCGKVGHNKKSCKEKQQVETVGEAQNKRGRPRKIPVDGKSNVDEGNRASAKPSKKKSRPNKLLVMKAKSAYVGHT